MKIQIEFFHDVLCAWCFAISPRVHKLAEENPDVEIIHRAFALAPNPDAIVQIFGSKENGKREILNHWRMANENDDEHRINFELMERREFDYPYSVPGLLACKSAELQGGQVAHWKMFDRVQKAHLVECLNIADFEVLKNCAEDIGLNVDKWERDYESEIVFQNLAYDLEVAKHYGINGVPALVANGRYGIIGAHKYEVLVKWLEKVKEELGKREL
ncbi:DsbA family oxidoreductase [Candidatus Kryptobacter tengchongensis]|uniref:DsbA family oxidoreductase n=1 Tax=Kryptobacter tengchongensis TaxID=1643429 RepID=UPI0007074B44|nr:DsbA family protein [Candidatus Kryptobacter tengchongensis]CUS89030.1 Predicted dithiol-disulfide isomerase, DsbA family [Candidatus Kryptobacter tengchongensis]